MQIFGDEGEGENMSFGSKARNVSASDFAYMELKEQIIKGSLKPNEFLIEEELAEHLGISRTPLREAFKKLEWEELVYRERNGRLRVASVSKEHLEEIFQVRNALECMVVEKATKKATEDDITKLKSLARIISLVSRENNVDETLFYGEQFHKHIYEMSEHETAIKILLQLNDHINRYRRLIPAKNMKDHETLDHQKILDHIISRDPVGAREAMEEHIEYSMRSAMDVLEKDM